MFLFPKGANSSHVVLRPSVTKRLEKVSVCLRSYSEHSGPHAIFSLAAPGNNDTFLISLQPPNTYTVYINQEVATFTAHSEPVDWRHLCVSWDSHTGVVQLWDNANLYSDEVSVKGSSMAEESSIVLGQAQGVFAGGFDASKSFVGEICDVHMWDYVLTVEDVHKVIAGDLHGNVINWISLPYEIIGDVLVKPKLHRKYKIGLMVCYVAARGG